jgi:hypothetical protein
VGGAEAYLLFSIAMTRQEEVLAHLGSALLSAQIVERFVTLMLEPSPGRSNEGGLASFISKPKRTRSVLLKKMLQDLRDSGRTVPELDTELRRFLKDRNKLVHDFQALGTWDFRRNNDCESCITFLRHFIDRAASLQHLFVSAMSVRDAHFGTRVSKDDGDKYADDYKAVYHPLSIWWTKRLGA